jgi:VWFA-related protein
MNTEWLPLFALLVTPLAVSAQAPTPTPKPPPAITLPPVEAELVQIDVVVTDRKGGIVRGLQPEDFEVLEDGKRQRVTHFKDGRGRPLPVAEDAPVVVTPDDQPTPDDWQGRYIVLAVDDMHMEPGNMLQAKKAFRRFVDEQVADDDLVALVATSGSIGYYHAFSRPGPQLNRAIERLSPRPRDVYDPFLQISEYQAELIDRGDPQALRLAVAEIIQRQAGTPESSAASQAQSTAQRIVAETQHRTRVTLDTLDDVVRSLAPLPGRKVIALASDGFLVGLGTRSSQGYDLRRIVDAATRSGVVVYAVDTRGLIGSLLGGDASSNVMPVMEAPGVRASIQLQEESALRDAMHALADDTGGFLVTSTNDLAAGFKRIVADNEAYYILAYEPTNSMRDGRFRKIQVKLPGHKDLRVRTRRGYFAPDDRKRPSNKALREAAAADAATRREADLQRGMSSLFPLRGLPVSLSADYVRVPPDSSQVVVSANVDLRRVTFAAGSGRQEAVVEVVAVVYDDAGVVAANLQAQRVAMSLLPETHQRVLKEGLRYRKAVALAPGLYQVRLVAREEGTAQLGSAAEWIEVPDLARGKLALSSVFLSTGPAEAAAAPAGSGAAAAPAATVTPSRDIQARKRLGRDDTLHFELFVYNAARDSAGETDVVLQAQVWSGPRMVASSPLAPLAFPRELTGKAAGPYASSFPLASFAPGSYELRLMVSDRKGDQSQLRRVTFLVE